ncbi:MAG: ribonuclease HII [bacterium]|nr:ribonuclease HII [bacterium]
MSLFEFDQVFFKKDIKFIAGADEVGRGPLAGPVVASMVILPENKRLAGLDDSKKLTEKKRERLYALICAEALALAVSFVGEDKVDDLNILNATKLAMKTCLSDIKITPDLLLIDGNFLIDTDIKQKSIVKGDAKSAVIAAASIVAKVERDRFMKKIHLKYPEYGFDSHKGYASKKHLEAIQKYGPCKLHRKSFRPITDFFNRQMEFGL